MNAPRLTRGESSTDAEVIIAHLNNLASRFDELKGSLESGLKNTVPRGEWQQRNAHVDGRFREHAGDITDIKTEITQLETKFDSARTPTSTIVATVIAVISLGWAILGPVIITGGN